MSTREAIQYALDAIMSDKSPDGEAAKEVLLMILDQQVEKHGTLCDEMDLIIFG
jgi:hypothetical protein